MNPKDKININEGAAGEKLQNARVKKNIPSANSKTAATKKNNDENAKKEQKGKHDPKKGEQEPLGRDHKTLSREYSTRQEKKKEDKKSTTEENNLDNTYKKIIIKAIDLFPFICLAVMCLLYICLLIYLFIANSIWTNILFTAGTALIIYYIRLHWKDPKKRIAVILSITITLLSIQVATPLFMPKVSLSIGETNYGYIYENYTETLGEITIDIEPPLFLIKKNNWLNTNCGKYRLGGISRIKERIRLDPISIGLKNNYSEYPDFYKDIVICLNNKTSDSEIDSWKLNKISVPIYIYSLQHLNIEINNEYPNMLSENIIKINWSGCDEEGCRYGIHINNKESFPILIRSLNLLLIENNTRAANDVETIIKNCKSKNQIYAFYTTDSGNPENNTSKKYVPITSYNAPIKFTFPVEYIESGIQKYVLHFRCNETIKESD